MSRKIVICTVIVCLALGVALMTESQGDEQMFKKLESGKLSVKNPFASQLPVVIIESKPEPNKKPVLDDEPNQNVPITKSDVPETPPRPAPILAIKGLIWNSDRPQAIIGEKIVNIGDVVAEVHITGIDSSGVEGMFDGRTITIPYKGAKHE